MARFDQLTKSLRRLCRAQGLSEIIKYLRLNAFYWATRRSRKPHSEVDSTGPQLRGQPLKFGLHIEISHFRMIFLMVTTLHWSEKNDCLNIYIFICSMYKTIICKNRENSTKYQLVYCSSRRKGWKNFWWYFNNILNVVEPKTIENIGYSFVRSSQCTIWVNIQSV